MSPAARRYAIICYNDENQNAGDFVEVHVLASGSTGNAVYINMDGQQFLVDAGISARRIERGLKEIGTLPSELDAAFITHEHTDHISGLPVFLKRFGTPVYSRAATWQNISFADELPAECIHYINGGLNIGRVRVESFDTPHDAANPCGFTFTCLDKKLAYATDLGIFTATVVQALADADAIILEANHDPDMLDNGPYPPFLKKRIRSRLGHLSNFDAAGLLGCVLRKHRTRVFLAHLSQENNCPDLAEHTVREILTRRGIKMEQEVFLHRTFPDQRSGTVF